MVWVDCGGVDFVVVVYDVVSVGIEVEVDVVFVDIVGCL